MTEKEIRQVIRELCEELDRGARRVVQTGLRKVVLPGMLGAGLALSAGACSDRAAPGGADATADQRIPGPDAAYALPFDGTGPAQDGVVPGPDAAYGVPFDGAPIPPYMAPDAGPAPLYAVPQDLGPTPPYMAPDAGPAPLYALPSDLGPTPPYMAPDVGPVPMYMPPFFDWGVPPQPDYMAPDDDGGIAPLYASPMPASDDKKPS